MKRLMTLVTVMGVFVASGCAPKANFSGNLRDDVVEVEESQPVVAAAPVEAFDSREEGGPSGGLLDNRIVYFAYDQSVVRDSDLSIIGAHSDYLVANPNVRVIIEGHTDNRGSNEYNLALGQRRADAVREIMLGNGVLSTQIETLSFGEEDPAVLGDNEEAWALNRRAVIRYYNE